MHRLIVPAVICCLIGSIVSVGWAYSATSASEEADALASHPLVGAWIVRDSSGLWPAPQVLVTFHSDGTVTAIDQQGFTWQGAWRARGERTADFTFLRLTSNGAPDSAINFLGTADVEPGDKTWIRSSSIMNGDSVKAERIVPEPATDS